MCIVRCYMLDEQQVFFRDIRNEKFSAPMFGGKNMLFSSAQENGEPLELFLFTDMAAHQVFSNFQRQQPRENSHTLLVINIKQSRQTGGKLFNRSCFFIKAMNFKCIGFSQKI